MFATVAGEGLEQGPYMVRWDTNARVFHLKADQGTIRAVVGC
jgi:hypothetical protein